MRKLGYCFIAAALVACSSPPGTNDTDGGTTADAGKVTVIEVSGTVQYHPIELDWRAHTTGLEPLPNIDGDTFNVEDAIRAQSGQAPLKTTTLASTDGKTAPFDVPGVDVRYTTLALVASVKDKDPNAEHGLAFSGYGLGKPPFPAIDPELPVYVVSTDFVKHLADIVGMTVPDLMGDEGLVMAQAVELDGKTGSEGVRLNAFFGAEGDATSRTAEVVDKDDNGVPRKTIYLNDDLTGINVGADQQPTNVTSKSGVFLRINAGSAATYTVMQPGKNYLEAGTPHYKVHLNGSRADTVLMVFFEKIAQ